MPVPALAGKPAPRALPVDVPRLVSAYYTHKPDPADAAHLVAFGTSGHRGSSLSNSFNEDNVLAMAQAICEHRHRRQRITGPLHIGMDPHALSEPERATAIEVFAANRVEIMVQAGLGYTPAPVLSHAILTHNQEAAHTAGLADGVVITPSHNPPEDGGFNYNPHRAALPTWTPPGSSRIVLGKNPGIQLHDRSRGGISGTQAGRGSGGI